MEIRRLFRQADWLAELQAVLALAAVVVAVAAVVSAGQAAFEGSVGFTVPSVSIDGLTSVHGSLRDNAGVDPDGVVDVVVTNPTAGQRFYSALTDLPSSLVVFAVLVLLRRIVRTARRGEPFSPTVVAGLRRLGVIAFGGGVAAETIQLIATFFASETVFDGFMSAEYRYTWWWFLLGFGFLAVAEVARRGAALRAELDEVV